jgi:hypothetical protein
MLDDTAQNLPAKLRSLSEIVAEYDEKSAAIPDAIEAFGNATRAVEAASCVGGTYARPIWRSGSPSPAEWALRANLLQSAWRHVYAGLNIDKIAPASDRKKFEMAFENPAPFTLDNIRATFGPYLLDTRGHILRGVAEAFGRLDQSFKSHDKMKIGVKGLPKRVILSSVTDGGYGGYGTDLLRDLINAVRVLDGLPHMEAGDKRDKATNEVIERGFYSIVNAARKVDQKIDGMTLKRFANGNGHLFFDPETLLKVNRALAEYFGEVLPDCPEARPERAKSTAVAKDLQFYRTPDAVADRLVEKACPRAGMRILEPSCGDGALLDAVRRYANRRHVNDLRATGVECDAGRAEAARAKGYGVHVANFLQTQPDPVFDLVLMNPPFYGKHYQKHVEHARKFLKKGGTLYAILPITALTDHGFVEAGRWQNDRWTDLPVGSFSESGTNINTGIATFFAP